MAGECTLVALSNRANTIFTMAGNLGENFVKTKRFLLRGGTHNETIGHVEAGKPITVTYHNGDTFESAHDLTRKFANKFTKLGDDDSVTLCGNAPICIHEHATQALYDALKEMIETIKDPPGGFAEVARELKKVTQVVREILQRVQVEWTFSDYAEFSAKLMLVSQCGARSVGEIDPFAFDESVAQDESEAVEEWIFAPDGDGFYVAGFGENGYFRNLKGFRQIFRLIQAPGEPVDMRELTEANDDRHIAADQRSRQPALTAEAKRKIYEQLSVEKADLELAKSEQNNVAAEHCREEIEKLGAELRKATGIAGKDRDMNNPIDRLRPTIHGSLNRAYKALREAKLPMTKLAEHFELSISSESGAFIYRPAGIAPEWSFQVPSEK